MIPPSRKPLAITGRRAALRKARSAGYTLLEVSFVVAMMVLVAAIAVPSLINRMGESRVDASADMVRARLADARSMAIQLAKPVRFGFMPGTGHFQIAADDDPVWDSTTSTDPVDSDTLIRGDLLQDVVFGTDPGSISNSDTPSVATNWETGGVFLPEGGSRGPFNPDGTSNDDARFYFGRAGSAPLAVELRGITGVSRISDSAGEGH